MRYGHTHPTEKNMQASTLFAVGIYPVYLVGGKLRREAPTHWVIGSVEGRKGVMDRVREIKGRLRLGSYRGPRRVDLSPRYLRPANR